MVLLSYIVTIALINIWRYVLWHMEKLVINKEKF